MREGEREGERDGERGEREREREVIWSTSPKIRNL